MLVTTLHTCDILQERDLIYTNIDVPLSLHQTLMFWLQNRSIKIVKEDDKVNLGMVGAWLCIEMI